MTWPAVALAAIASAQVLGLAWIALRQQQVKQELARVNGRVTEALDRIEARGRTP